MAFQLRAACRYMLELQGRMLTLKNDQYTEMQQVNNEEAAVQMSAERSARVQ